MPLKKEKNEKNFKEQLKDERRRTFETNKALVNRIFKQLELQEKSKKYFQTHASEIINLLRTECWKDYLKTEGKFTQKMLLSLMDTSKIKTMDAEEAVTYYVLNSSEEMYHLGLSNTNSRRSRAGKEFEKIIELVLEHAGVTAESQGKIGKKFYKEQNLTKLVDIVIPSAEQFLIDKRKCLFVSAKTTVRERWQEIPEEIGRTGIHSIYLATLDEKISDDVLRLLYEGNIIVTTTKDIKDEFYSDSTRIITFEDLIQEALHI